MPDVWRREVQSRLERYKRRRGRRIEGAFSMRFPFPPAELPAVASSPVLEPQADEQPGSLPTGDEIGPIPAEAQAECHNDIPLQKENDQVELAEAPASVVSVVAPAPAPEPEPEEAPVPVIELPPRPQPRRKVIAFPIPPYEPIESARRIADPVQPEQLRILDVPEELQAIPATPFLDGLLEAPAAPAPGLQADGLELPCATARAARRLGAALIDAVVVLSGVAISAAAASRFLSELAPTKFLIAGAVTVYVLLWVSYQYLFLVFGGRTLGMRATRVRLQTFKGRSPNFRRRQLRVFGLYLSVLSLGMGVLWYFVDVDSLCWHDRISQTFPAAADKS